VRVKGKEEAVSQLRLSNKGALFLPNHVSNLDPVLVLALFWPDFKLRPLAVEYLAQMPGLRRWAKALRTVPIPDFDTSVNPWKRRRAERALAAVSGGLEEKERFLFYPTGHLKDEGAERLGGASGLHTLLQKNPTVDLVLIRITGLWGSRFSRAFTGKTPAPIPELFRSIVVLIQNLFLFAPRRAVTVEVAVNPPDFPRRGSRPEINAYLENWYNRYPDGEGGIVTSEPLQLVRYNWWSAPPSPPPSRVRATTDSFTMPPVEVVEKVYQYIRNLAKNEHLPLVPAHDLALDVGLDSLDRADLGAYLATVSTGGGGPVSPLRTVQDALECASLKPLSNRGSGVVPSVVNQGGWPEEKGRPAPRFLEAETVLELFLKQADRMGSYPACGDDFSGVFSYARLKRSALVLSRRLARLPGERIGIVLPASNGVVVALLATYLANKVPVMLNWTLGPRYVEQMAERGEASHILTSWKFLERISYVDLGKATDQVVLLEEIREELTWTEKLAGGLLSLLPAPLLTRAAQIAPRDPDSPAIFLFTSGTEAVPKCVPLSHANLFDNIRQALEAFQVVGQEDTLYSTLPPFHALGLNCALLLPLLTGVKIAFYPDPTDASALVTGIERWRVTIFPSPPSFLKRLFATGSADQLKRVRLYTSGGEKVPPELFEQVARLGNGNQLLQGYGMTECTGIVSMHRLNSPPRGVGKPLSSFSILTLHPETGAPLPEGAEGEICLSGPSVFAGYWKGGPSPFIEFGGRSWYKTGDLGWIDREGTLFLSGRLRRFVKVGAEMISLAAVEEALHTELVASGAIDREKLALSVFPDPLDESRLLLFTATPLECDEANGLLKKAGFSNLIKIANVQPVAEIPVLATGKVDYRRLRELYRT
jgi:long-chain-fatty-acid--[acyl-carrier-protein] ligase